MPVGVGPGDAPYELETKRHEDEAEEGYETDTPASHRQRETDFVSTSGFALNHENMDGELRHRTHEDEYDFPSEPEHSDSSPHERTLSGTESNASWVRPESPSSFWDGNSSFSEVSTPSASDTNEDDASRLNNPRPRRLAY
ncbi:hypothetical protein TRICI_005984 [Trichomonascus ciferrii]|uniref:Uncharacterized protein n=1 Tax=Trichomonascus ciferrii TaxID=44093 RepID=A0A642UPJ2_9ASCO|nr:hypothetical protein TRICI_005984 [Trichomonascus ciferrii]